ncbi:MAG: ABC transporter ATP-binding protein [Flavobacteriaceae bacterium]|nr:ABC transporter ATP-binding protein [Flavobacteriaceae bacterium]
MSNEQKISGKTFDLDVFKRILKQAKVYKWPYFITGLLAVLLSFLASARPMLLIEAVNTYIAPKEEKGLLFLILLMLGLLLLEVILQFGFVYMANWLGQHVIKDLRKKIFEHILHFRMAYFDHSSVGRLVTRVVTDLETIAEFFSQGLFMIVGDLLKMVVVIVMMFTIDWRLSLITLSVLPFLILATRMFQKGIKTSFQEVRKQVANLNSFVQERISGMSVIQLFTREKIEYEKFKEINNDYKKAYISAIWYYSIFFPITDLLSSMAIGLIVWYGGLQAAVNTSVQPGEIIGFIMMTQMLFRPLRQIADKINTLQMGIVAGERIFNILDTEDRTSRTGTVSAANMQGKVSFEAVHFSYIESEPVLKGVTFEVQPGETLAIVGATGAGKSTIINLVNRFYDIEQGSIKIDGVDLKDYELSSLRSHIAVVLQDVFLFSDSILNNITLKNEDITLEMVQKAAKAIGVDAFIETLPNTYQYQVKERGAVLSTGQRQLIAFLRAYVSQPRILILDEATSSVDSQSEQMIQKALEKLTENRTSIIIAHRLATIQKADRILVMDQGQIVEQGTHQSLLEMKDGVYRNLYEKQFLQAETS